MIDMISTIKTYFTGSVEKWILALIGLIIGVIIIQITDKGVKRFFARVDFERSLEIFIERTSKIFLWIILITIILSNIGFNVTGFVAGLGVAGIIIGFATKDIFGNLAAGLLILMQRPIRVGEDVEVAGIKGRVKEVNVSSCILKGEGNTTIVVPNSKVWGSPIKNFSRN